MHLRPPYIIWADLAFVLFLCLAYGYLFMDPAASSIELPVLSIGKGGAAIKKTPDTVITIFEDGRIFLDDKAVEREELPAISQGLRDHNVYILADRKAPTEATIATLWSLHREGVKVKIGYKEDPQ